MRCLVTETVDRRSRRPVRIQRLHGNPLGAENLRKTKEFYGWDPDKMFVVPGEALEHFKNQYERIRSLV